MLRRHPHNKYMMYRTLVWRKSFIFKEKCRFQLGPSFHRGDHTITVGALQLLQFRSERLSWISPGDDRQWMENWPLTSNIITHVWSEFTALKPKCEALVCVFSATSCFYVYRWYFNMIQQRWLLILTFTWNCDKRAFLCSSWTRPLLLAGIFPFFLSVQDALIPARFHVSNRRGHSQDPAQWKPDWFTRQWNRWERLVERRRGTCRMKESWRRCKRWALQEFMMRAGALSMQIVRSLQRLQGAYWAGFSAILGERKTILPACLSLKHHILAYSNISL